MLDGMNKTLYHAGFWGLLVFLVFLVCFLLFIFFLVHFMNCSIITNSNNLHKWLFHFRFIMAYICFSVRTI